MRELREAIARIETRLGTMERRFMYLIVVAVAADKVPFDELFKLLVAP